MPAISVFGAQWGDEGKGKIIDLLARQADLVVRYQGGPNAGHTVVVGKEKYVLHLVPSGILHAGKTNVIGNGAAVDPIVLLEEIDGLRARGVRVDSAGLALSSSAHMILDYHRRIVEWFDHYLKGETAPSWITDGVRYVDRERELKELKAKKPKT